MYQVWKNVSLGVGAQYFRFNLEVDTGSDFRGEYDLQFIGPTAFLAVAF